MPINCPRCGSVAEPAGHEDARAFFRCPTCTRIWTTHLSAFAPGRMRPGRRTPRVLVVDDAPEMLGLVTAWLEDDGCVVIATGSGREALDAARVHQPDVAFVDLLLPPPDGFHVCESLTRQQGVRVVLMTGLLNVDLARITEVGGLHLLRKPFTREELIESLNMALDRRRETPDAPSRLLGGGLS